MVAAYVRARQTMGMAVNRQRVYHDEDTTTCFFKPGDWVLYWNKPKSLQTLSSGWTEPFIMVEKVSLVDYTIQFAYDGKKKMNYRWTLAIKIEQIELRMNSHVVKSKIVSTDRVVLAQTPPRLPTTTDTLPGTGTLTIINTLSKLQGPKYREGVAKTSDKSKRLVGTKLHRSNRLANKFKCVILSFMFI